MIKINLLCKVLTFGLLSTYLLHSQTPAIPFGSNSSYSFGTMQNVQGAAAADAVTQSWYNYWKTNFTRSCGTGKTLAINDYNSQNAYSEGQGYGLLLAAYLGDKALFDALWKGYKDSRNSNGVMHWTVNCSSTVSANGATDGDLDAAMGLLVANKQWPNTTSPHNYSTDATALITAIKDKEFTTCNGKTVQKPGDMFGGCDCTNPSYYAVGYYRAFGRHVTSQASFWEKAANDGLELLLKATNPNTGLNPAWTDQTGSITTGGNCNVAASGGGQKTDYQFDAARTPWRIVVDYLWWGTADSKKYLDKVSAWANTKGISNIVAGFKTDGTNNVNYKNSAFTGAFAIGAMATGNQTMVNNFYDWWTTNSMTSGSGPLDDRPYFQNSLRVMYSLVASGNFWNPYATVSENKNPTVSLTAPTLNLSVCAGTAITLTASASDPDGTISKVEFYNGTTLITSVTSSPYTYSWTTAPAGNLSITAKAYDNSTGTATSTAVTVNVTAAPAAPTVTTPVNYCLGSTASALTAAGTSLKWYTSSTGTGSTTAPVPSTTTAGTQNYWVSQTSGNCESAKAPIVVNINQTAAPTATSPVNYCQGATATALTASGTALKWYLTQNGTSSATAPVPTTTATGVQNYWVTQTVSGCESPKTQIVVNVGTATATPTVVSPVVYCQGVTAKALTATGTNLLWYTSANGTGSSTAPVPSTTAAGNTTYWVSQTGTGCESPKASIVVTVVAAPAAPTVTANVVYNIGDNATPLTATGTNLKWYLVATNGTASSVAPVPNTDAAGNTTYYVSQTNSGDCESPRASITVRVTNVYRVYKVGTGPVVDGTIDAVWNQTGIMASPVAKSITGTVSGASDLSVTFKAVWDNTYLYVLGDVTDNTKTNDSPEVYNDDAPEIYLDINNDKATTYGSNDVQYSFGWNDAPAVNANPSGRSTANITYATLAKADGYVFEARIPWATVQGSPAVGQLVGFDFMVNDDDDGGERDGKLAWNAATDDAWQNPSLFGTILLGDILTDYTEQLFENMQVYPNPAKNQFMVTGLGTFDYSIVDQNGKVVETGVSEGLVDIATLQAGVYSMRLKTEGVQKTVKIVKMD